MEIKLTMDTLVRVVLTEAGANAINTHDHDNKFGTLPLKVGDVLNLPLFGVMWLQCLLPHPDASPFLHGEIVVTVTKESEVLAKPLHVYYAPDEGPREMGLDAFVIRQRSAVDHLSLLIEEGRVNTVHITGGMKSGWRITTPREVIFHWPSTMADTPHALQASGRIVSES